MVPPPKKQPVPFGKYLLLDRINIGGMAEVWRGKEATFSGDRLVAIKRILPSIAEDEEFIRMFIDEAKISSQLIHANIAQVYELGHIQNSYFIAMEYIPGRDLRAIFEKCRKNGQPPPIPLACHVIARLSEGLDYAHQKRDALGTEMHIVHRDVSPQNVLISYEGEVKVIDFGIAKAAGKATRTEAGILKGKFGYMSPEQIQGHELDRRADIFAIGICLYELLTGQRLFVGESDYSILERIRKADVPAPSKQNPNIPETLERIVLKALALQVEQRYQHAGEVALELEQYLASSGESFGPQQLSDYIRETFHDEVERERARLEDYAQYSVSQWVRPQSPTPRPPRVPTPPVAPSQAPALISEPPALPNPRVKTPPRTVAQGPPASTQYPFDVDESPIAHPPPPASQKPDAWAPGMQFPRASPTILPPDEASITWSHPWRPGQGLYVLLAFFALSLSLPAYLLLRPAKTGYLLVEGNHLPAQVRVNVNGVDLDHVTWPVLQRLPQGKAVVLVSAEGYSPFVQTVNIQAEGISPVNVELSRPGAKSRIVVVTEPEEAEIQLNGKVVKAAGAPGVFVGEVPTQVPQAIAVSHPGYHTRIREVLASQDQPLGVIRIKLARAESTKPGGVTP